MINEWTETKIEDIVTSISMGPFGSDIKTSNFVSDGVPIIRGGNLVDGKFHDEDFVYLTEEKADSLKNSNAFPEDIVFTHRGTLGQVGLIPHDSKYPRYVVSQSQMRITCDKTKADPKFVYYFFLSPIGQNELLSNTSTTGVPAISRPLSSLKKVIIPLPPLPVQKKIAAILSSLDDKIELNTRMNNVLEQIARALFHRWFVEFEFPNAEGKPYKSAGGKMVESEMGSVPEGWRVGTLDNVVDIIGGGTPKTSISEYWNGTIPWFSVVDAPNDGDIFVIDTEKHITQLGIENSSTRLLPVGTTIISARGTVGKCAVVGVPMTMNQSCYGIRGKEEGVNYFVYFTIRSMVSELQSKGHGSVFNTITRDTINTQKIVVPDVSMMKKYNDHVTPLLQKIQMNLTENRHLSKLRDGLLPKLMNWELEV